ncbi:MAG TPA: hypothetical protein VGB85_10905 [Nannocystis sp.]
MADDGSIAPDPRRLARAQRAGLRPGSPWLTPAVMCLALAAGLRWGGPAALGRWRAVWMQGTVEGVGAVVVPLMIGAAVVAVAVAALAGSLGWVDARAREGLAVGELRSAGRGLLALLVPVLVVLVLAGVVAGAARAVDASEAALIGLWWAWAQRLLVGVGGLLLVAGVVDRALGRRRLWLALHRDPDELRRGEG